MFRNERIQTIPHIEIFSVAAINMANVSQQFSSGAALNFNYKRIIISFCPFHVNIHFEVILLIRRLP
jgi:hypothetical protein